MKYSNYLGVVAGITIIVAGFLPWVYISSIQTVLTGFHTPKTNYGKPAILNVILAVISIMLFLIPATWAKRLNVVLGAINFAWTIRNYILLSQCEYGECPQKQMGLYMIVISSVVCFLMALFPSVNSAKTTN